jgi:hypothetical protein
MKKTTEARKYGAAPDRNTPRSTSIGGHSKSAVDPIVDSELPLNISQKLLNTLPEEFQVKAHDLEKKGLVRIVGEV